MAWAREQGSVEELVVATDSRLRAGYAWDAAPKIIPLPREDSVLAFAGDTDRAYPMMIQAFNAVGSFRAALDRSQSLEDFKGHLVRMFNFMIDQKTDQAPVAGPDPEALFILAGFSWRRQHFRIWIIDQDRRTRRFSARPAPRWGPGFRRQLALVGDNVPEARAGVRERLRAAGRLGASGFDWEPLHVLAEMCRDKAYQTIGGAPQVVKIYRSLKVTTFAVPWHSSDGQPILTVLGRPLLAYEVANLIPRLPIELEEQRRAESASNEAVRQSDHTAGRQVAKS
jgi:hypothetical protein